MIRAIVAVDKKWGRKKERAFVSSATRYEIFQRTHAWQNRLYGV